MYLEVKRPGLEAEHNIMARFRMSGAILPPPLYAVMVYMGTDLALSNYGRCKGMCQRMLDICAMKVEMVLLMFYILCSSLLHL
jgi:hypothetical protein